MVREAGRDGLTEEQPVPQDTDDRLTAEAAETLQRYRRALAQVEELHSSLRRPPQPPSIAPEIADAPAMDPAPTKLRPPAREQGPPPPTAVALPPPSPPAAAPPPPTPISVERPALVSTVAASTPPSEPSPAAAADAPLSASGPVVLGSPGGRRAWRRWALLAVGVVVLALLATVALRLQTGAGSEGRETAVDQDIGSLGGDTILRETDPAGDGSGPSGGGSESGSTAPRLRRLINRAGSYSFVYPSAWELDASGEIAKVSSPDGQLVSSFALGPRRLRSSYKGFVRLLADSYDSVLVQDVKNAKVSGNEALSVTGRGRDASGRRISFRALLVERRGSRSVGGFAVTVGRRFDQRLDDVLLSLQI